MSKLHNILKKYWGYDSFRKPQEAIIESVLEGKNTLALLPTGAGKSICYAIPALLLDGITIVISPLIALMNDQVNQLKSVGIKAVTLHSEIEKEELNLYLDQIHKKEIKILFIAPERLMSKDFNLFIKNCTISLLVIDEAHCISQWGTNFRKSYLKIGAFVERYELPFLALTASANKNVTQDIFNQLGHKKEVSIFKKSVKRTSIFYQIENRTDKRTYLQSYIEEHKGKSGLIYVNTRKEAESVSNFLQSFNSSVSYFHAGLKKEQKEIRMKAWYSGEIEVMVCTTAFGMGINKNNVRYVVHYGIPQNLENFYQESGRAGRDGLAAKSLIIYNDYDKEMMVNKFDTSFPKTKFIQQFLQDLYNYIKLAKGSGKYEIYAFNRSDFLEVYPDYFKWFKLILNGLYFTDIIDEFKSKSSHLKINAVGLARKNSFLEQVLRLYPGITYQPVTINEFYIASKIGQPMNEVKEKLKAYHLNEMVMYDQSHSTSIKFNSAREDSFWIKTLLDYFKKQKQIRFYQLKSIFNFIEIDSCKHQFIQEYFNEKSKACKTQCSFCVPTEHMNKNQGNLVYNALLKESKTFIELLQITKKTPIELSKHIFELVQKGKIKATKNQAYKINE